MDQTNNIESRFEELRGNFDNLNQSLQEILSEELDLETAGITAINERLGKLGDLKTSIRSLFDEANNAYNHGVNGGNSKNAKMLTQDEFINLASSIQEFIKAQEAKSAELRAERERKESLRKIISDKVVELNNQIAEYDAKEKEVRTAIEKEKEILAGELSEIDRKYHEALLAANEAYLEDLLNERKPLDEQHEKWTNEMSILLNGGQLNYELVDGELVEKTEEGPKLKIGNTNEAPEEPEAVENNTNSTEMNLPPAPEAMGEDEKVDNNAKDIEMALPPAPEAMVEDEEKNFPPLLNPVAGLSTEGIEAGLPPAPEEMEGVESRELPPLGTPLVTGTPEAPINNEGMEAGLPPAPEAMEEATVVDNSSEEAAPVVEEVEKVTDPNPSLWKKVTVALLALANAFLAAIAVHTSITARNTKELLNKFANQQTDEEKEDEKPIEPDQIPSEGEVEPSTPEKEPEDQTDYEKENGLPIYLDKDEIAVQKNSDGTKTEVNHNGEVYTHEQDGSYTYEGKTDLDQVAIDGTVYGEVREDDFSASAAPQKTGQEQSFEQASQNMSDDEQQNLLAAINGVAAEDLMAPEPGSAKEIAEQQQQTSDELASYDWSKILRP